MLFIIAFFLGYMFTASALLSKYINSSAGAGHGPANRKWHAYFSVLGNASNFVLPLIVVAITAIAKDIGEGLVVFGIMYVGGIASGYLGTSYRLKLLISLIGIPLGLCLFLVSL